jgi:hypothetical protein
MRFALLLLLSACGTNGGGHVGGPPMPLVDEADVREAVYAAYLPVTLALYAEFLIALPLEGDPCPVVVDEGDGKWTVDAEGCTSTDDDGHVTTYTGGYSLTGVYAEGEEAPEDEVQEVRWNGFGSDSDDGATLRIQGLQRMEPADATSAMLTSNLTVTAAGDLGPGMVGGEYEFEDHVFTLFDADEGADVDYAIDGDVEIPDKGHFHIAGTGTNDDEACPSEPVRGEIEVRGSGAVTVTFDGETSCDGSSPMSGDLSGSVAWDDGAPLGCSTTGSGGLGATILVLAALGLRRR